jgi:hypothetical protein
LVTPIENLSQLERKKLNQRSFIYVHTHPRAATKTALMRRVDDELLAPPESKEDKILRMEPGPRQEAFKLLALAGVHNSKVAAKVAARDDFQAAYRKTLQGDAMAKAGRHEMQQIVVPIAKAVQLNLPFDDEAPSSAVRNSNGGGEKQLMAQQFEGPTARTADHPSAAVLPAGTKVSANRPTSDTAAESLVSRPRTRPLTAEELMPVAAAMARVDITESRAVSQLFGMCRDEAADCTPDEVATWIYRKISIKEGQHVRCWVGYLHTSVPPCFQAPGFEKWRAEVRAFDALESENIERQRERARYILSAPHPPDESGHVDVYDETDRQWARKILGAERVVGVA